MDDVKKSEPFVYWADCADPDQSAMYWHKEDALTQLNDHGGTLYELSHTSELHAQRLRADTAEAEVDSLLEENKILEKANAHFGNYVLENRDLVAKLAAAEQRIATITSTMSRAIEWFDDGVGRSIEEFQMLQEMRAALNPKPEAGSHDRISD